MLRVLSCVGHDAIWLVTMVGVSSCRGASYTFRKALKACSVVEDPDCQSGLRPRLLAHVSTALLCACAAHQQSGRSDEWHCQPESGTDPGSVSSGQHRAWHVVVCANASATSASLLPTAHVYCTVSGFSWLQLQLQEASAPHQQSLDTRCPLGQ